MLFNSAVFIFVFLPITWAGHAGLNKLGLHRWAMAWLVGASACFYGWFSVRYLAMLGVLVVFNYMAGTTLLRSVRAGRRRPVLLAASLGVNLAVLGYFKYSGFFIDNVNALTGTEFVVRTVVLPIGISFFTFQKIAYLVDASRGEVEEYGLLDFSLFVMFFPQLIAGPIVHHRQFIPQFHTPGARRFNANDVAAGLALFTMGLVKKIMIADTLVQWSDPIFASAQSGNVPSLVASWIGALSFTLQIYFDFSGYTDMALGLALMFGVRLPLNFDSPYKATSIVEFWRRWHMTLSRFLRDYVYIPLGGNRHGEGRRSLNLIVTMLVGGLWHGAAWTFIVWGGLHALYLTINHGWQRVTPAWLPWRGTGLGAGIARLITFLSVVLAWILFRSASFAAAIAMLRGMAGLGGVGVLEVRASATHAAVLALLMGAVWLLPNSQQLLAGLRPALQHVGAPAGGWPRVASYGRRIFAPDGSLRLNALTGAAFAAMVIAVMLWQSLRTTSLQPFIYFQF